MAHKKAGGSTRLGRDSQPKYLGTKVGDGETVQAGMILVRQRGTRIRPGKNVKKGKDDTLYAAINGKVAFKTRKMKRFNGLLKPATFVQVLPAT